MIGKGQFGQAIASLLEFNKISFEQANRSHGLTKVADILFIAVPVQNIRSSSTANLDYISSKTIVVNCSKGIEEKTHLLPHQIVQEVIDLPDYCSLSGPSFAAELLRGDPTNVSLGYTNERAATQIKKLLTTPYFRIEVSPNFESIELAGALKNVYAILCGYAHGLGFESNTQARLILAAQQELVRLAEAADYPLGGTLIPAICGDLILTCSSKESRNYSYGYGLAKGRDSDPRKTPTKTIEGFHTSHSVKELAKRYYVYLPMAELTYRIISGHIINREEFITFMHKSNI